MTDIQAQIPASQQTITLDFKEIVKAIIIHQEIHEGLWGIYVEFGIGAGNFGIGPTPDNQQLLPGAIVPIVKMGIQKYEKANNMTIDASEINPKS